MEQEVTLKYKNAAMNAQRDLLETWYEKLTTAEARLRAKVDAFQLDWLSRHGNRVRAPHD